MTDGPDNLVLLYLRRIEARIERIERRIGSAGAA
jgi:hypothetical protein